MICQTSSEVVLRPPLVWQVYSTLKVGVGCEADQNRKVKVVHLIWKQLLVWKQMVATLPMALKQRVGAAHWEVMNGGRFWWKSKDSSGSSKLGLCAQDSQQCVTLWSVMICWTTWSSVVSSLELFQRRSSLSLHFLASMALGESQFLLCLGPDQWPVSWRSQLV